MEKRWRILSSDDQKVVVLQQVLKIHPVLCSILVQRGLTTFEEAKDFFRPKLEELHDPWLMKDMQKAVDRIINAVEKKEKILIFGDYDVDGTTAVACMYSFLYTIHPFLDFYIPHRYKEGYGISKAGIDFAKENGFTLILSLDCGIKSIELISYAKQLGIEFIICDHHMPDTILPEAIAILNPKQKDCNYPYKELCGCGVGLKLITALARQLQLPDEAPYQHLDLVATAIAADIVPMTGENRILAYYGLKKANENPNYGIKALSYLSGWQKQIHIGNLVFMIAPRVNAAGRMDDARKAVEMFIAPTYEQALSYANLLQNDNADRKEADTTTTNEALALIAANPEWAGRNSTLVFQPHWHKGVVGIVASRLIEHYYRPTIVLTQSGEYAAGSARSIPGFNLYEAIHTCRDHLIGYGGHFAAAGMTLKLDKVAAFREKFEAIVTSSVTKEQLTPEIVIDAAILLKDINWAFYNIIRQMEPFGPDNLNPVFITHHVTDTGYSRIVKEQHIRFSVQQDGSSIAGIGFNMAAKFDTLGGNTPIDIVYKIDVNEWNNEKTLQIRVIDFRPSLVS